MEIEQAKAISLSSDWELVCKEIDLWIGYLLNKTRTCSPEQLPHIQAEIGAYEKVKNLPRTVIERDGE